jgi:hypothetical protein
VKAVEERLQRRTAMNTQWKFLAHFLTGALAIISVAPASRAQNLDVMGAINVSFASETGYQHFAPGRYTVRMDSPDWTAPQSMELAALELR